MSKQGASDSVYDASNYLDDLHDLLKDVEDALDRAEAELASIRAMIPKLHEKHEAVNDELKDADREIDDIVVEESR